MVEDTNKVEKELMSEEEFKQYLDNTRGLKTFDGVIKFKSIRRAMKRGAVTDIGVIAPRRPFNNRKNTSKRANVVSRVTNEKKKNIYKQFKQYLSYAGL